MEDNQIYVELNEAGQKCVTAKLEQLIEFINARPKENLTIYCKTKQKVKEIRDTLRQPAILIVSPYKVDMELQLERLRQKSAKFLSQRSQRNSELLALEDLKKLDPILPG